jgi:hypothetical protein
MLTEKEQLALEQLEAEHSRRIDEKVEKGIAIRVPLPMAVVGVPEGAAAAAESAQAVRLAELKAGGETRELYFEDGIAVIITGVPRAGRDPEDAVERLVARAKQTGHPSDPILAQAARAREAPQEPPPPEPELEPERHYVRVEIRPSSENDPGAIIEGSYALIGNLVQVWDLQGKLLGSAAVHPDENPDSVARRILRARRNTGFYDPLPYPRDRLV